LRDGGKQGERGQRQQSKERDDKRERWIGERELIEE